MPNETDSTAAHHRAHGGSRSHNRPQVVTPSTEHQPPALHAVHPARRIWLEEDGVRMFGPGTYELLWRVQATGSLSQAARDMSMSYSKAWRSVRDIEGRLGISLFERRTGGADGGGSRLTTDAQLLLQRFDRFLHEADAALTALFRKHFGDVPFPADDDLPTGGRGAAARRHAPSADDRRQSETA